MFKNSSTNINGLEGASGVTYFDRDNQVVVTGFYDRVFDSDLPVAELEKFGLLGAWDIVKTTNE